MSPASRQLLLPFLAFLFGLVALGVAVAPSGTTTCCCASAFVAEATAAAAAAGACDAAPPASSSLDPGRVELAPAPDGSWTGAGLDFSLEGRWQVVVYVQQKGGGTTVTLEVPVRPAL